MKKPLPCYPKIEKSVIIGLFWVTLFKPKMKIKEKFKK